jgi:hypothetical protein
MKPALKALAVALKALAVLAGAMTGVATLWASSAVTAWAVRWTRSRQRA